MNNEEKIQLYSCIKRQFTDPGLYKSSRIYEWLFTNGYSLEKLGYESFEKLCVDFPEVFSFQDDPKSEFVLINSWQNGDKNIPDEVLHPADRFFGKTNIILNDDIIEMTQQSLYALTKILGINLTVQQMKQEIYRKFDEAKQSDRLEFIGDKYVFPIERCPDGQWVNGIITKNINSYGKSLYFSFEKTRNSYAITEERAAAADIPEEEKKRIYSLLAGNFPIERPLHMASISKFLTDRGVDRMKYGYFKMKDFFAKLGYLEMSEVVLGGVPQVLVMIKEHYSDIKPEKNNLYGKGYHNTSYHNGSEYNPKNNIPNIPEGRLTDFCNLPAKPMTILENLIDEEQTDRFGLADIISEDFDNARNNSAIRFYGGKMVFPCRYKKSDGSNIELILKPSTYEGKAWFLYYVDTVVRESKIAALNPVKQLESFAYLGNWQTALSVLAAMAAYEEWDFKKNCHKSFQILSQYLKFTFSRILHEKKLCVTPNNDFAAFNTGLVDRRFDDIFACFVPNENGSSEWRLIGFFTAASNVFGKRLSEIFDPLPSIPVYFARNEDMFFDPDRFMYIDYERLLMDNLHRFPTDFLYERFFDDKNAREILEELRYVFDRSERIRLFGQLKELIASDSRLLLRLQNVLKAAVEFAKKRAKRNYKTAVPSYFPKHDSTALLLPLAFKDETTPDAALVLEITRLGGYQAQTILTLSQAYIDARLISSLSSDWLAASQINSFRPEFSSDEEMPSVN